MDQALNSQKTPHTSPLRASYGMSFVSILMKNDRVIKGFYCSTQVVFCCPIWCHCCDCIFWNCYFHVYIKLHTSLWLTLNSFLENVPFIIVRLGFFSTTISLTQLYQVTLIFKWNFSIIGHGFMYQELFIQSNTMCTAWTYSHVRKKYTYCETDNTIEKVHN